MYIKKCRREDGIIVKVPNSKKDLALFKHCSNGEEEVTAREFNSIVWPLLQLHGVRMCKIINKVTKIKKPKINTDKNGHSYNKKDVCTLCGHSKYYAEHFNVKCPKHMEW